MPPTTMNATSWRTRSWKDINRWPRYGSSPWGEVRIAYGLTEEHVEILDVGFRLAYREDHFYARLSERIDAGDYDDALMEIRAFAAGRPP
jgi:hypothetical protein